MLQSFSGITFFEFYEQPWNKSDQLSSTIVFYSYDIASC